MVKEEKIEEVEKLRKMIEKYDVIGIANIFGFPTKQFQEIRNMMKEKAMVKVVKKNLLKLAIKNAKKEGICELEKILPEQVAIVLGYGDAFKFYSMVSSFKSRREAKEGDIAQNDIVIPAGPTVLPPGPAISELSKAGIPAGVEEGKIAIKKDVVVAKKGDKISKQLASVLKKLNIEPIEIFLELVGVHESNRVYGKEILELIKYYPEKLKECHSIALTLAINISYPTKESVAFLFAKAFNVANSLKGLGGVM